MSFHTQIVGKQKWESAQTFNSSISCFYHDGCYIAVYIWQNSSKSTLKIGAFTACKVYLRKFDSEDKKQTKKRIQFYIPLMFVCLSSFWHFYYQGFWFEYSHNEQSYYQKLPVLGLQFSQEINF